MWKIVALQWAVGLCLSAGLMWVSTAHALSAFWGVVCVALPSSVFALRLTMQSRAVSASAASSNAVPMADAAVFLVGEFLKIFATIALLAVVAKWVPGLVWWALLLAVVATIKSYFLIFLVR